MKGKNDMKKDCLKKLENICEQLGEDLSSERCQKLKEHLENCPTCCAYVDTLRKTVELCRNLPDEKISNEAHQQLWKKLQL